MRSRCDVPKRLAMVALLLMPAFLNPQILPAVDQSRSRSDQSRESVWPAPTKLLEQLKQLQGTPAEPWANATRELLESISTVSVDQPMSVPDFQTVRERIAQLQLQSKRATQVVASLQSSQQLQGTPNYSLASAKLINQLYQIRYCIDRRISVWSTLLEIGARPAAASPQSPFSLTNHSRIRFRAMNSQWRDYLLLDDVKREFNSLDPDSDRQKKAARRTLGRIYSPVLKPEQKEFLQQAFDPQLISFLRETASDPIDIGQLLQRMEQHEQFPTGATEFRLNDLYQDLAWSEDPRDQKAAQAILLHYRNANVRLSVSGELLNRLVPDMPATRERVSDRVLGAAVSGQSYISNRLEVQLIPDPNQVQLRLQTVETVRSNTVARRDGFAIQNMELARFQVFKRLAFGRDGVDSSELPVAYSTADQQVVGMRSKLDGVPLFGRLARKIASQKIQDEAPKTQKLVRDKVEREASERMQEQVEAQLQQMRASLYDNVLQPLLAMELEPEPVQMSTTEDELVMRYRLAGRDQMAASSARPAAVEGSLCNCQVHESVLNNAIMRLGLNGNEFTAAELQAHFQQLLGTQPSDAVAESEDPPEARFEFAPLDPIRVRLDDQKLTVELNLASMQIGDGRKWRRISVKTSYVPRVQNGTVVLDQSTDGIRLKGKRLRFRDQVALRTVFEVLFQSEYQVTVLPEQFQQRVGNDLSITQLVLADGWLGVSIDDAESAPARNMEAQRATQQPSRMGQSAKWAKDAARRSRR